MIGYARVSTDGQSLAAQVAELKAAFRELTGYEDQVSKTKADFIKRMKNWQRERELNADIAAAQAKNAP